MAITTDWLLGACIAALAVCQGQSFRAPGKAASDAEPGDWVLLALTGISICAELVQVAFGHSRGCLRAVQLALAVFIMGCAASELWLQRTESMAAWLVTAGAIAAGVLLGRAALAGLQGVTPVRPRTRLHG